MVVGLWHVQRYGVAETVDWLRSGIRCLNDAHGTPNTDDSGYHETVTRAYVVLIAQFLAARPDDSLADAARALIASPLAAKDTLLAHYSRDVLMSVEARRGWVPPDRRGLDIPDRG